MYIYFTRSIVRISAHRVRTSTHNARFRQGGRVVKGIIFDYGKPRPRASSYIERIQYII